MTGRVIALIVFLTGCVSGMGAQPVDSLCVDSLMEITVVGAGPVKAISQKEDGATVVYRRGLSDAPSFMGGNDVVGLLRTMPAVATNNDLQASINVKGYVSGANAYYADGMRIVNPLHLLGFYSAFNPSFFNSYDFRSGFIPSVTPNTSGVFLEALTQPATTDNITGEASVGLIESHCAADIPIVRDKLHVAAGGRLAYPSKVFPDLLKLGTSSLDYGFWDANLAVTVRLSESDMLKVTAFADRDNTNVEDSRQGAKEGFFRWSNIASGIAWRHHNMSTRAFWTRYRNKLFLNQGGRTIDLPSGLDQMTLAFSQPIFRGWHIEADVNWRRTLGQYNESLSGKNGIGPANAVEINAAVDWEHSFNEKIILKSGIRFSEYITSGYHSFEPQPRVSFIFKPCDKYFVSVACQRLVRFDRLIETSSGGLPSDFWLTANQDIPTDIVNSFEICAGGRIPGIGGTFRVEAYVKRIQHATDYTGSVMDMLSPSFQALAKIIDAQGWSRGCLISIMRQFGKIRGRLGYNIGRATLKNPYFGGNPYPASYDRLHDLSATIIWQPIQPLQLSATYIYATGLPYTQAKYGYMIGENIICEYFPHNSSRLPDYKRLDVSASWHYTNRYGLTQKVTLSVYNALGNKNVLFRYQKYSVSEGISQSSSVMKMIIPSITYSITLK